MTLAQQIADAKASYHRLLTGTSVRVFVDQNGERVEYTATSKANLWAYILLLESQLCNGGISGVARPLNYFF